MRKNRALRTLRAGEATYGLAVVYGSPEIAELSAHLGLDWTWLDWQHGTWTEASLMAAVSAFLATETVPLVRVRGHEGWEINRVLDMGAMGVIVPMVNTPEEAERVARAAKYTPLGDRSGGGLRLPLFGDGLDPWDYFRHANEEIMVVVMLETVHAMERAEAILSVPGVDVALIGPGDLLMDVRANGGEEEERDRLAERLLEGGRKVGKPVGYVCSDPEMARIYVDRGFRFVSVGWDSILIRSGFKRIAETVRGWPGDR